MFTQTSDTSPPTNKRARNFKNTISSRYRIFAIFAIVAVAAVIFAAPAKAFNATYVGSGVTVFGMLAEKLGFSTYEIDDKKIAAPTADELAESVQYSQGFEVDGVWSPSVTVNRVASGTDSITSKSGGFHGKAVSGNSTRWGGFNSVFPALGYTTSVDIYLNMAGGYANDTRFDFTSAINTPADAHRRDFAFNGGYYNDAVAPGTGPRFVFSASNSTGRANSNPKNPGRSPIAITDSGWYKFKHTFRNTSGTLAVDLSIINSAGVTVATWTLSDPSDLIPAAVGGNRYGWFSTIEMPFLAIDDSYRANIVPSAVVTVRPESMNGWVTEGADGGAAQFINDATAPAGFGALALTSTNDNNAYAYAYKEVDVPLAGITEMSYYTKKVSGPASANPAYVFRVYLDGTASTSTYMFYEPYYNGTVQTGTWQQWDVAAATKLWSSSTVNAGSCQILGGQLQNHTLDGVKTACPNAVVKGIYLNIGTGNPNYNVQADMLAFNGTVYDFEPTALKVVDVDGFASATDCNDVATPAHQSVGAGVAAANPGDTVRICPGTYPAATTVNLNKTGLTLVGVGPAKPVIQTSGFDYTMLVTASGVTLDNLEIQKTDVGTPAPHNMIGVQGSNFIAQNNLIYGPNPGSDWSVNNIVSRAFEISGGLTGIAIQNNTIQTLRQPAYMGSSSGTITNNIVYGTRGWVVDGAAALYTFTGNSWGTVENQGCDIALINATVLANYTPLLALSTNNSNAFICSSGVGGPNGRATAYVNNAAPLGGSSLDPYSTIQTGIDGALPGGTVEVAAGTYVEEININKKLNVLGPNANIDPNTGSRVAEAILHPTTNDPSAATGVEMVIISAEEVVFKGFTVDGDNPTIGGGVNFNGVDVNAAYGIDNTGTSNPRATIVNNIVKNLGEFGIFLYGTASGGAANSTIQGNKIDNIPGQVHGQGIHFRTNAYANVNNNVITRVGFGIVSEDFFNPGAAPATISNNAISAHIYGIRQNAHYGNATSGFTVSNNTVGSYVEGFVRSTPVTRYNGIRIESIQGSVPVNVVGNTITPDRTALVGNGYSRVDGVYITNTSTVSPNIVITGNTISNALRGISHTTAAVPTVTCNLIMNNDTGVYIGTDIGFGGVPSSSTNGINLNNNNIVGNTSFGVQNDSSFVTNADNNFWGSASGPGGSGPGSGDDVSANVDFSPFAVAPNQCAGLPPAISISGTVSPALACVTINLSGDQIGSTVTDGTGNYSFTGLTSGGNYLVTPSLAGYNFDPTNRSYSDLTTNVTNANFTRFTGGSPRLISVVSQNVVPGNSVVVPVALLSQGDENTVGFSLTYDPAVLSNPVVALGTDSVGGSLVVNDLTPGVLGVIVARPAGQTYAVSPPARQLVTITFNTVASPPSFSTPLTFSDSPVSRVVSNVNADELSASYSSGAVTFATGFESDVAPRFTGSNTGSVNGLDYSQTGRFAAGLDVPNPLYNEFQRVDAAPRATKGNGSLNGLDYSQAGRYAAGLDTVQSAGGPAVANLFSLEEAVKRSDDNLFGGITRSIYVESKSISSGTATVTMSVKMAAEGNEGVMGFTLSYDQSVLGNPIVTAGADAATASIVTNTETHPGRIGVLVDFQGNNVIPAGTRELVTVQFAVLVTPATTLVTPVGIPGNPPVDNVVGNFNDSQELPTVFTTGNLTIFGPTAASVSVGGQVMADDGRDLGNVRLTLTDSYGVTRSALSNAFGFYRFDDVIVGQTYVISATRKGYTFQPQAVTINDQVTNLNIIADR